MFRSLTVKFQCLVQILHESLALFVHFSQFVLCIGISLLCSFLIQINRLFIIMPDSLTIRVHIAKPVLGIRNAMFRSLLQYSGSCQIPFMYIFSAVTGSYVVDAEPQFAQSVCITMLRSLQVPLYCLSFVTDYTATSILIH